MSYRTKHHYTIRLYYHSKAGRLKKDENLRYIRKHRQRHWKEDSGYQLSARLLETQNTQALIRYLALNKMSHLRMPHSYLVAQMLFKMDNLRLPFDLYAKAN